MDTEQSNQHRFRRMSTKLGLLAAGAIGGTALAWSMSANAATPTATSTSTGTVTTTASTTTSRPSMPAHGTAAHEDAEKAVRGATAAKVQAAAVKAAGGGTAGAVTTDFSGRGYEVTVTKNGVATEYHLDNSFTVMKGGPGGPGGPRGHQGMPPKGAPATGPQA